MVIITCLKCNRHVDTGTAVAGDVVKCRCGLGLMVPEGPAAAGKMNCPACGAPVDPDLARCNYCDTKLATVMCPSCFGTVFDGVKHCPHCGEALSERMVIHHGDETEHKCPRCDDDLRIEVVAGAPLERCPGCEGLWVDRETAERLYKHREQADPVRKMTKPQGPPRQEVDTQKVRKEGYIKCPVCQGEPIADSPSELAQDMMLEVERQVAEGKTNAEIIDFFTDRYGEGVLLDPPFEGRTLLLWVLPFVALAGGLVLIVGRTRRRAPAVREES